MSPASSEQSDAKGDSREEKNRIGVLGATSYIVGAIIGSAIFISPKGILQNAGSIGLSLIIWVICAMNAILNGINYIELGTSIPESGGEFAYLSFVGWKSIAFSFLWIYSLFSGGAAFCLTFGKYIVEGLNPVINFEPWLKDLTTKSLAFLLMLSLTTANLFSLRRFASKIQVLSMFSKLFAVVLIIGIGAYFVVFRGGTDHFASGALFAGSKLTASDIVLAIYQGNWAYGGYTVLNNGIEDIEIRNFRKTLPIAVIGGIGLSAFVYVLVNIAYFSILTPQEILESEAVATLFIQRTIGPHFAPLMPLIVGLLMIGSVNANVFHHSRQMFAGARRSQMPKMWSLIHPENRSPRVAVISYGLTSVFFLVVAEVETLVSYLTLVSKLGGMFTLVALIYIKVKKLPVASTAIRFPLFFSVFNLCVNISLLVLPLTAQSHENLMQNLMKFSISIGVFLFGLVVYFVLIYPKNKPRFLIKLDDLTTSALQRLTGTVVERTTKSEDKPKSEEFESRTSPSIT